MLWCKVNWTPMTLQLHSQTRIKIQNILMVSVHYAFSLKWCCKLVHVAKSPTMLVLHSTVSCVCPTPLSFAYTCNTPPNLFTCCYLAKDHMLLGDQLDHSGLMQEQPPSNTPATEKTNSMAPAHPSLVRSRTFLVPAIG